MVALPDCAFTLWLIMGRKVQNNKTRGKIIPISLCFVITCELYGKYMYISIIVLGLVDTAQPV